MDDTIVYFELNNWFPGRDYPNEEPFTTWCGDDLNLYFSNDEWVKVNRLCVVKQFVDMSVNWCISAPKAWVVENCPKLLDPDAVTTVTVATTNSDGTTNKEETYPYRQFLRECDEDGEVWGEFGCKFVPWSEENVGILYFDEDEYKTLDEYCKS